MDKEAQDAIDAYVKSQLESEGISQPSATSSVKAKKPNPPAHIPGEAPATNVEGEPTASEGEPSNEEENPNIKRFRQIEELERQKKSEETKNQDNALTGLVGLGAGAGALGRYMVGEVGGNLLKPSEKLFAQDQKFNPETIENLNSINSTINAHQDTIDKINAKILETLRNPNVAYTGDPNSPGALWASKVVNQDRPDTSVTEAANLYNRSKGQGLVSGRMTKMWGARQAQEPGEMPISRLDQLRAQSEAKASQATQEQQGALDLLNKQLESETTKRNLAQQSMEQEANLAKSRGYRAGALRMGMGVIGGATLAPDVYGMYQKYANKKTPLDSVDTGVDVGKIAGDLMMMFGTPRLGALGAGLQIPWAVHNREALLRGMTMGDINPTAFPRGLEPAYDENAPPPR